MKPSASARIFISYSHRGNGPEWKAWLLRHLNVFEQHHLLDVWQDGKIRVSAFWDDDIKQAMSSAHLAIVLLTPEALQSRYILEQEFPFLRERQQRDKLRIFPVICEECDWKAHDWLRATQAPAGSKPLSSFPDAVADHHLRLLATAVAEELSRVTLLSCSSRREEALIDGSVHRPTPSASEGTKTYLEKFPITGGPGLHEEKLIGREQELALLDLAFAQPHTAIVSLVAWGGVGKTMLVQHWLRRLLHWSADLRSGANPAHAGSETGAPSASQPSTLDSQPFFTRVYAWSFYSQGTKEDRQASEDTFPAHALAWFGVQCEPTLSPWDKGRLLADAVARERTLLILDGIEPLQYPPGPMGGQLRAPGVQSLLKQLARKSSASFNSQPSTLNQALCLVTTREPLTDLADFQRREGSPWGSVLRVDLGNLTDEAGAALLHHAGANRAGAAEIKPDDKDLFAASREVDGHALTLNLLGRFLAHAHGGNIHRRDLVKFGKAEKPYEHAFKMLAAFENWFNRGSEIYKQQLAILRMLGLFDRPADAGCIAALRKPPVLVGMTNPLFHSIGGFFGLGKCHKPLNDEDWNTATGFLEKFGLIQIQSDAKNRETLLDCHPLIREHFARQLRQQHSELWRSAHQRIFKYLKDSSEHQPITSIGLQPLYQALGACRT